MRPIAFLSDLSLGGLLDLKILGNEVWRFLFVVGAVFLGMVAARLVRFVFERVAAQLRAKERDPFVRVTLETLSKPTAFLCVAVGLSVGLSALTVKPEVDLILAKAINVLFVAIAGYAAYRVVDMVDYYLTRWLGKTQVIDTMLAPLLIKSLHVAVVALTVVFALNSVVGAQQLATILAGLGVGGLAVALAAQDTIKNFFGSLMIALDKPFNVGDRVVISGHDGPVESVGLRSTRIRTLDGHLITLPNGDVANAVIQNIGRRPFVRRVANIGIPYDTPPAKVERAIEVIKEILAGERDNMDPSKPPWVVCNEFGPYALNIYMIYWFRVPDQFASLEFANKVNMQILRRFEAEGIKIALPAQTLHLADDVGGRLASGEGKGARSARS